MASKELVPRPAVQPPALTAAPPFEQPKRDSESAAVLAGRWARRNRHVTVPLAVPPVLWLAAFILSRQRPGVAVPALVGVAVAAACVWFFAPHKWRARNGEPQKREVWYARLSALLAALWLVTASRLGPASGMPGAVLAGILAGLGVAWGYFWWDHKRPRGQRKRDALIAKWDTWWQSHAWAWNLGGSAVVDARVMGVTTKLEIAGLAGRHTVAHLTQVLGLIESGLDGFVDVGRVRAETVPGRPNHFYLYFKQANPLAQVIDWDPAIAPRSVHDDAPVGLTETGAWKMVSQRKNVFVIGETRSGKALALDTPVPTPAGWTTMGDLRQGDVIFDEAGQPCRVTDAWDVRYGRPCYEIQFSDESTIVADADHQWLVETNASRRSESRARLRGSGLGDWRNQEHKRRHPEVLTTAGMAGSVTDGQRTNYSVRVAAPLAGEKVALPVPPYTLGAWLGDGWSATGAITTPDPEVIAEIEAEGEHAHVMPSTDRDGCAGWRVDGLSNRLLKLGVRMNKHIPLVYLRASEPQRRALLAGLLDTDGYCGERGTAEYCSTSERLARDVHHLAATLGYKPTIRSKPAMLNGKDCGTAWTVAFTTADKVFRLPRKAARLTVKGSPRNQRRFITAIRPVPSVPVRCVAVDSPSHLFLVGETCIPTHNSNHLLVRMACLSGCPDDRQVLIDLKGGRSARPALETGIAEYVIVDVDEARMYLLMLVTEIAARAMYAYDGHEQLQANPDTPALHTLIDETHGLTSVTNGDAECSRHLAAAASQGAGVEVYEEVYTQYGSLEESVRTEQTRGNLLLRFVYRVAMASHGQFAIEEWNKLDASKLEEQGTCYVKDGPKTLAEQVRAPKMSHALFKRVAANNAALAGDRAPLRLWCGEQVSPAGVTWQEWWDKRWLRLHRAFHAISPQYQDAAARYGTIPAAGHAAQPPPVTPETADARSVAAQMDAELEAARMLPEDFRPPKVNLAPVIARKKAAFAEALAGAGERGGISPAQLIQESGMSRSWTMQMLRALSEHDALTQLSRGLYVAAPGADIRQAIRDIQAGNDQLLAEARQKISNAA